tara:strand:+ start:249 stop:554 length:306 start_codon:yes stop_codon:yes gene_type:complete
MPSKGKNRAARQSQLRNKRKKGSANVVDSRTQQSKASTEIASPVIESSTISQKEAPKKMRSSSTTTSLQYPYLKGELIRISSISVIILLALISLNFISLFE